MTSESERGSALELTGIKAEIFEIILEYAYTGTIIISETNAEDLLRSSTLLEVRPTTEVLHVLNFSSGS